MWTIINKTAENVFKQSTCMSLLRITPLCKLYFVFVFYICFAGIPVCFQGRTYMFTFWCKQLLAWMGTYWWVYNSTRGVRSSFPLTQCCLNQPFFTYIHPSLQMKPVLGMGQEKTTVTMSETPGVGASCSNINKSCFFFYNLKCLFNKSNLLLLWKLLSLKSII